MHLDQAADIPLIENPNIPVIYADGVCEVEAHGSNVRITFFELRNVCGREVRSPVLAMIRPINSLLGATLAALARDAQERQRLGGALH